jgi:hypothetical protein
MRFTTIIIGAALSVSCQPAQQGETVVFPREQAGKTVNEAIDDVGRRQAEGLKTATVVVHGAYAYSKGYTYLEPIRGAKLVAVDVEFTGVSADFDLDDVDIIDGASGDNYGSDPEIAFLTPDGSFLTWNPATTPVPLRTLLIYAVPDTVASIRLSYWGEQLTQVPVPLGVTGLALPPPPKTPPN